MKKRLKRITSMALSLCVLLGIVFTQAGALCRLEPQTFILGDFKIIKEKYEVYNKSFYPIYDFTDIAKTKENMIIPCELNGKHLALLERNGRWAWDPDYHFMMDDCRLKKVFLVGDLSETAFNRITGNYVTRLCMWGLYEAPRLSKIIFNEYYFNSCVLTGSRYPSSEGLKKGWSKIGDLTVYLNIDYYLTIMNECFYAGGVNADNFYEKSGYKIKQVEVQQENLSMVKVSAWNTFEDDLDFYWEKVANVCRVANVHFMYNYKESPKYGYYWIDDIDNGKTIQVIPENPIREGYEFGGWYTEPECINEFNFDTPIVKNDIDWGGMYNAYAEIPQDYITYLYAKWIEN